MHFSIATARNTVGSQHTMSSYVYQIGELILQLKPDLICLKIVIVNLGQVAVKVKFHLFYISVEVRQDGKIYEFKIQLY